MPNGERLNTLCDLIWIKRATPPSVAQFAEKQLTLLDLFSGCGGLTLGVIEGARQLSCKVNVKLAVDISPHAIKTYQRNLGSKNTETFQGDILSLFSPTLGKRPTSLERRLIDRLKPVSLIVAGPPCQGHSDLNNSTRRNDPRNALYLAVIRAAELLRPSAIISENVPSIVHDKGNVLSKSISHLSKLGYHVSCTTINALDIGLPQSRKRHILLATREIDIDVRECFGAPQEKPSTLYDYIGDLGLEYTMRNELFYTPSEMSPQNKRRAEYLFKKNTYNLPNWMRPRCHQKKHSYISMYGRLRWDLPAQTITSGFGSMGQGRFLHPSYKRTLTPHEAARLQGFPDFFSFSDVESRTALHELIGNAVPPRISAMIVSNLVGRGLL